MSQHEGLIVDVMHGDSSTTTSPLTESSLSTTSAAISSLSCSARNEADQETALFKTSKRGPRASKD